MSAGKSQRARRLRGLYAITDARAPGSHLGCARAALAGGAGIIQLRAKELPTLKLLAVGHRMRQLTYEYGALLIINDRCDIAWECRADGVHLGPDDASPAEARRVLGPDALIGVSCGDENEARASHAAGADYIGAGAVFGTQTKLDAGAPIGLETLRRIVSATPLPVAAIGGISRENIGSVLGAGALMACVVSAISRAGDAAQMEAAARDLAAAFEAHDES